MTKMQKTITIQNLKCGGCARTITTKVSELNNIENVKVDVENSTVTFDFITDTDFETVKDRLNTIGYPVVGDKNSIGLKAKSFVSCASGRMSS